MRSVFFFRLRIKTHPVKRKHEFGCFFLTAALFFCCGQVVGVGVGRVGLMFCFVLGAWQPMPWTNAPKRPFIFQPP